MKKKQIGVVPLKKDSFKRLFGEWYSKNDDASIKAFEEQKEMPQTEERVHINEIRLMRVEGRLDLHGCTGLEASIATKDFLTEQYYLGKKKVEIVTGKGLHSKDGIPVVKDSVTNAIKSLDFIREFYSPRECYGGSGTIHIIFKQNK